MKLLFVFFYVIVIGLVEIKFRGKYQKALLILTCIVLTFLIGYRDRWPDEGVYVEAFRRVPNLWGFSFNLQPFGYVEKGYYLLASIVKTIYNSSRFYLLVMGGLSMFLLYKSLQKYCIIPLIGLCDYIARFLLNRDYIQMRSSLAILLIVLALKYVYERKIWHYFAVVFVAYQIHHLALIAVPFYFLCMIKFKKWHIVAGVILAMVLSQTIAGFISGTVDQYSTDLNYATYTRGSYVEQSLGLRNLMIYFQILILLMFTFSDRVLRNKSNYYEIFKTGYFYSTLILIFFCNYTALSGRTSTLFASLEMFILPMIAITWKRKNRIVYYIGIGFIFFYFFAVKYDDAMLRIQSGMTQIIGE
jgi:hypothetical protein